MNMAQTNKFRHLLDLGYDHLLCVVPHDAPGIREAGKRPGRKGSKGWYGVGVREFDSVTLQQADLWHEWGGGVGIRCNGKFVAIDIDSTNPEWAEKLKKDALETLGPAPLRIGRAPKCLLVYRAADAISYRNIRFEDGMDAKKPGLIECLSGGDGTKWFVASGIHPVTGKPYTWPQGLPHASQLTPVTEEQVASFFDRLKEQLPKAQGGGSSSVDRDKVDQQSLKGDMEEIAEAMRSIPNDGRFDYDVWIKIAAAINGACQEDPHFGLDIFCEFSERYEGEEVKEDPKRTFKSLSAPYGLGADYVLSLAKRHASEEFKDKLAKKDADIWFEDLTQRSEAEELFAHKEDPKDQDVYPVLSVADILNRPPPSWLVKRHLVQKAVGFLYSEPGAGKTFWALDMAMTIAVGLPDWHGDTIDAPEEAAVLYIASEGSYGFRNRIKAWHKARGIPENLSKRFHMIEKTINFMKPEDIQRLIRTVRSLKGVKLALVVVDTVSRAMPGADENLQKDMTRFVEACDAVRDSFGCAVLGVHHAGKSGDMRGSTVLLGAGDFVFRLTRKKGVTIGHIYCEKQKDAPDGWEEPYRFDTIDLDNGETSLVPTRADMTIGPSVELTPDMSSRVLAAMRAAWDEGEPWSKAPQSKERYAIKRMVSDFGFDAEKAEETLTLWEQTGLIAMELVDRNSKRRGLKVAGDAGQPVQMGGIFD